VYGSTKVEAGAEVGTEFAELWYLDAPIETVEYVWFRSYKMMHESTRVWVNVFVATSSNVDTGGVLFDKANNVVDVCEWKIVDFEESLRRGERIF
jgi:hypothetical protein